MLNTVTVPTCTYKFVILSLSHAVKFERLHENVEIGNNSKLKGNIVYVSLSKLQGNSWTLF